MKHPRAFAAGLLILACVLYAGVYCLARPPEPEPIPPTFPGSATPSDTPPPTATATATPTASSTVVVPTATLPGSGTAVMTITPPGTVTAVPSATATATPTATDTPTTAPTPTELPEVYTVQRGDHLWGISDRFYGDGRQWTCVYQQNLDVVENPSLIFAGERLRGIRGCKK